jgi:hypothetical protein
MSELLTLNPERTLQIKCVGNEKTPVIIIDDLLLAPKVFEAHASAESGFDDVQGAFYPGKRKALPRLYIIDILRSIYQKIVQVYNIPTALQLKPQAGYYSLVTQQPSTLTTLQRIPHFDAVQPYYFALLHYINPSQHGGTGFFRDNTTQYERITPARETAYLHSAKHYIEHIAQPKMRYITESTEQFTLYDQVDYCPNRLVIYPGNLLHSGLIIPDRDISADPTEGRLTANIFIEFK